MKDLLNYLNIYKIIKRNPLKSLQTKVDKILSCFNLNGYLQKQYHNNSLTQTNTQLPKAYGLPKIHKVDIPLRSIISTVNSPIHFLAKILNNELKNCIKKPKSYINNNFKLKEKLADVTITSDCILVSLDVSSLFTNIPYQLVINSLEKRFNDIHFNLKIPFQEKIETTKFLCDNTFFIFE